jgi:hypothetical protein
MLVTSRSRLVSQTPAMRIYSYGLAEMCEARIPIRFWIDGGAVEYHGETLGIAPGHFIVKSDVELEDGMRLLVKLRVPTEPSGDVFSELELYGWVVCGSKLEGAKFGSQVELEKN